MQCPNCSNYDNKVIKSYMNIRKNIRIRIRICTYCGAKLPSEEKIVNAKFLKMNPNKKNRILE